MIPALLAFAESKRYPKIEPGLDLEIGWWVFLLAVALCLWAWSRAAWLRRALLAGEDPRIFALLRVMMALFTFACFWNLEPYWRFLWSDEGMFTLAEAQQRLGRAALSGWTAEDGFLDHWAVVKFFWTKPSLWFLQCSPAYVYGTMAVFFGLLFAYAIGLRTRVTGVLCWLMINSIYARNSFYLEGTDTVYRVLWFYILFARTDAAWSVDNAIRVWREKRREAKLAAGKLGFDLGLFLDRLLSYAWAGLWGWLIVTQLDMHFDAPWALALLALSVAAAEAVWAARRAKALGPRPVDRYLLVPRWPRVLIMIQYAFLYCSTGAVKTGVVWMQGHALYYALNLDHFYRFEGFTQWMSAYFGWNFFRLATWVTHFWEIGFPVVLVGVWLGYRWRHRDSTWARRARGHWRYKLGTVSLVLAWAAMGIAMSKSLPYLFPLSKEGKETMPAFVTPVFNWVWGLGLPLLFLGLWGLSRWAPTIPGFRIKKLEWPAITVDAEFLRAWLTGRRVWLTLGVLFHGFLVAFMNIGMFPFIMLGGYLAFTSARPWLSGLRWADARWTKGRFAAALAPPTPAAEVDARQLGRRGGALIDARGMLVMIAAVFGLIAARGTAPAWFEAWGTSLRNLALLVAFVGLCTCFRSWGRWLLAAGAATSLLLIGVGYSDGVVEMPGGLYNDALGRGLEVVAVALGLAALGLSFVRRRRPVEDEHLTGTSFSRALVIAFALWHVGAVAAVLYPNRPIWGTWHSPARRAFGGYLRGTNNTQSWNMFAPNPPRANSFSRTVLVDAEGEYWDLNNNAYYDRPSIFWANDRMRKMQRRLVGKGKWYQRYWSEYHCREWELAGNPPPQEIQIYKIVTRIPKPNKTRRRPWDPRKQKATLHYLQTHRCDEDGSITPVMKERRGMELDDADRREMERDAEKSFREANTRREAWERRRDYGGEGPPAKASFQPMKPEDAKRRAPPPAVGR